MMAECIAKIRVDSSTSNKDETISILSEALQLCLRSVLFHLLEKETPLYRNLPV